MKGLLLALMAGLVLFAVITWCLRHIKTENRARMLTAIFLAVFPLLIIMHAVTPADLGILHRDFVMPIPRLDLAFALFLYTAGFFGGVLQLYNLADRGLSLRMLIDILETPSGAMTPDRVMTSYGGGRGIVWMYDKRIDSMKHAGLVREVNGRLMLTKRGFRLARICFGLQKFARAKNRGMRR